MGHLACYKRISPAIAHKQLCFCSNVVIVWQESCVERLLMQMTWPLSLICVPFELIMIRTLMSFLGGARARRELTVKPRRGIHSQRNFSFQEDKWDWVYPAMRRTIHIIKSCPLLIYYLSFAHMISRKQGRVGVQTFVAALSFYQNK